MPASQPEFSPRTVACALGVGESSIKRWCDGGSIRTVRTHGGHRRIPLDAVLEFLAASSCELQEPSALGLTGVPRLPNQAAEGNGEDRLVASMDGIESECYASKFAVALKEGDESRCSDLMMRRYDECGSATRVCEELLAFAMKHVGKAWESHAIEIYQERRACCICDRLVHRMRDRLLARRGAADGDTPRAIGCSPSGDPYSLPSALVELSLLEAGWNATNHGNDLPLDTMLRAALDIQPALVWVSISYVSEQAELVSQFNRLASSLSDDVMLVVGGRGLTDSLRPQLRYTAYCDNLQQLVNLANTMRNRCA